MNQVHDYKTIIQHSTGQWDVILPALGVAAEYLTNKHKPCPACGGKDRFRYDDKQGRGTFVCGQMDGISGDGFALVQHVYQCDFKEAVRLVAGVLGIIDGEPLPERKTPPQTPLAPPKDRINQLAKLWHSAALATETEAIIKYFMARGLDEKKIVPLLHFLRFKPMLDYWEQDSNGNWKVIGQQPAMLAKFERLDGMVTGLHRTYLNNDFSGKAVLLDAQGQQANAKKMLARYSGSNRGASIHLGVPDDVLAVAEGIESAAAVHELSDFPVWASGSAGSMGNMELPISIRQLHIYADTDANGSGIGNARKLENRAIAMGIEVRIFETGIIGIDTLDLLVASKAVPNE